MTVRDRIPGIVRVAVAAAATLWLNSAAADPGADYETGARAYREDDVITAMRYLERAATAGHADAQFLLGYILDKAGENETAMTWYQSAFENGSADAAFELGTMHASGDGVAKDLESARSWYEKSAATGSNLAPDEGRARELLGRAADNGHEPARVLLESLDEKPATTD